MHSRREIALGFTSCYFTPFLSAILELLIPNTTAAPIPIFSFPLFKHMIAMWSLDASLDTKM